MSTYTKFVNLNLLNVAKRITTPITAGKTSKNHVKYSLGLIADQINNNTINTKRVYISFMVKATIESKIL